MTAAAHHEIAANAARALRWSIWLPPGFRFIHWATPTVRGSYIIIRSCGLSRVAFAVRNLVDPPIATPLR